MKVLTAIQTKNVEQRAFNVGISGERLMENAGCAAAKVISKNYNLNNLNAVVVVGQGNNGGDGYVVARKLKEYGAKVTVVMTMGIAMTRDSSVMQRKAKDVGVTLINYYDNPDFADDLFKSADLIVDAIFGIGFHGAVDKELSAIIEKINDSNASKIALDIPSGVIADTGEVLGSAIKANMTVSFIGYKPCHFLFPSTNYCGKTVAVSIGIEDDYITECFAEVLTKKEALSFLKPIPTNAHKGTKGTALIIGGSFGMAGAPMLSAKAAMRSGVGIVKVCLPKDIYSICATILPEAVFKPLDGRNGFLSSSDFSLDLFKNANAVLIGPGMGVNDFTIGAVAKAVSYSKLPTVIDADGLNAISEDIEILKNINQTVIITPHPGEMARLTGKTISEIENNRISVAKNFANEYGVITVLKGAYTVVAFPSGKIYINTTGNQAMATAGSGDMLAGMIVAFLANGTEPEKAVVSAVCLHGVTGDKAAQNMGVRGVITSDMIDMLPSVLNSNS